jgi:hypothetical protein
MNGIRRPSPNKAVCAFYAFAVGYSLNFTAKAKKVGENPVVYIP